MTSIEYFYMKQHPRQRSTANSMTLKNLKEFSFYNAYCKEGHAHKNSPDYQAYLNELRRASDFSMNITIDPSYKMAIVNAVNDVYNCMLFSDG